ncbi:helix-turn-helix domain-containing protein [Fulvivirgaceae bacterium PWU20]|uniref:Helix-turn-helix domain-containing protein n=2 Tax=Chryseosolibacter indicus TaxID=2782351 RepID=A0ABS5VSV0_9BACT|nr:helix-turn-helix domain-containing protein [Chryseosolibacter indicus]
MYPVLERIELKVGAQIMFVRNDPEGNYYNGKLATVKEINGNDVWVELAGTSTRYKLKRERWENKKYALQKDNLELDEEVVGSFEQFPIKLAWAITVHKSQGLTFDKAIIDVGQAFADGQVYVALSRLRTLDGLVLRAKIQSTTISTDKQIVSFVKENHQPDRLNEVIKERQHGFLVQLIEQTFDFSSLARDLHYTIRNNETGAHKDGVKSVLQPIANALDAEKENTVKYRRQLAGLLSDHGLLVERLRKGSDYYKTLLAEKLKTLVLHQHEMHQHKRVKTYVNQLTELDVAFTRKLDELDKVLVLTEAILNGKENIDVEQLKVQSTAKRSLMMEEIRKLMPEISVKEQKKTKKEKKAKKDKTSEKSTYDISLELLKSGMTVTEIAAQRQLAVSTIEGHLAKGVASGAIPISTLADDETVREVSEAITTLPQEFTLKELFEKLNGRYGYGVLKAVVAHTEMSKSD